jgi:hypothetical protein
MSGSSSSSSSSKTSEEKILAWKQRKERNEDELVSVSNDLFTHLSAALQGELQSMVKQM